MPTYFLLPFCLKTRLQRSVLQMIFIKPLSCCGLSTRGTSVFCFLYTFLVVCVCIFPWLCGQILARNQCCEWILTSRQDFKEHLEGYDFVVGLMLELGLV